MAEKKESDKVARHERRIAILKNKNYQDYKRWMYFKRQGMGHAAAWQAVLDEKEKKAKK